MVSLQEFREQQRQQAQRQAQLRQQQDASRRAIENQKRIQEQLQKRKRELTSQTTLRSAKTMQQRIELKKQTKKINVQAQQSRERVKQRQREIKVAKDKIDTQQSSVRARALKEIQKRLAGGKPTVGLSETIEREIRQVAGSPRTELGQSLERARAVQQAARKGGFGSDVSTFLGATAVTQRQVDPTTIKGQIITPEVLTKKDIAKQKALVEGGSPLGKPVDIRDFASGTIRDTRGQDVSAIITPTIVEQQVDSFQFKGKDVPITETKVLGFQFEGTEFKKLDRPATEEERRVLRSEKAFAQFDQPAPSQISSQFAAVKTRGQELGFKFSEFQADIGEATFGTAERTAKKIEQKTGIDPFEAGIAFIPEGRVKKGVRTIQRTVFEDVKKRPLTNLATVGVGKTFGVVSKGGRSLATGTGGVIGKGVGTTVGKASKGATIGAKVGKTTFIAGETALGGMFVVGTGKEIAQAPTQEERIKLGTLATKDALLFGSGFTKGTKFATEQLKIKRTKLADPVPKTEVKGSAGVTNLQEITGKPLVIAKTKATASTPERRGLAFTELQSFKANIKSKITGKPFEQVLRESGKGKSVRISEPKKGVVQSDRQKIKDGVLEEAAPELTFTLNPRTLRKGKKTLGVITDAETRPTEVPRDLAGLTKAERKAVVKLAEEKTGLPQSERTAPLFIKEVQRGIIKSKTLGEIKGIGTSKQRFDILPPGKTVKATESISTVKEVLKVKGDKGSFGFFETKTFSRDATLPNVRGRPPKQTKIEGGIVVFTPKKPTTDVGLRIINLGKQPKSSSQSSGGLQLVQRVPPTAQEKQLALAELIRKQKQKKAKLELNLEKVADIISEQKKKAEKIAKGRAKPDKTIFKEAGIISSGETINVVDIFPGTQPPIAQPLVLGKTSFIGALDVQTQQDVRGGSSIGNVTVLSQQQQQKQEQLQRQQQKQLQKQQQKQVQKQLQQQKQLQKQLQKQVQKQQQLQKQAQKQLQKQQQKQQQKQRQLQKQILKPRVVPPSFSSSKTQQPKLSVLPKAFKVGVIKEGRKEIIATGLTREAARSVGAKRVLAGTEATFFLEQQRGVGKDLGSADSFKKFRQLFRPPKGSSRLRNLGQEVFIQKKTRTGQFGGRLAFQPEKQEIKRAKRRKRK